MSSGQPTQQAVVGVEGDDKLDRAEVGTHRGREAWWNWNRKRAERAASSDKCHGQERDSEGDTGERVDKVAHPIDAGEPGNKRLEVDGVIDGVNPIDGKTALHGFVDKGG